MIPVIYAENETAFTSNGLGRLSDATKCVVTEQRNGKYELELRYPVTGVRFDEIQKNRIILATHDDSKIAQPFRIYRHTKPMNGVVTFYAHHISYDLSGVISKPFTATSAASAMEEISQNCINECAFTFWTDKASSGVFDLKTPMSVKSMLGGVKGSFLDVFGGGEYEFDRFLVRLWNNRGADNGVTIRRGKNLTNIRQDYDIGESYTAVVPYYKDQDDNVVYGDIVYGSGSFLEYDYLTDHRLRRLQDHRGNDLEGMYSTGHVTTMDLSDEFDDIPTQQELEARAKQILDSNSPWEADNSLDVDFVALWQTEEYENIAPLQQVRLCDTVTVVDPLLRVEETKIKVVKTVYNTLADRYDKISLGNARTSFAQVIEADTDEKMKEVPSQSTMERAIANATSLITGGMGGNIVFLYDANGKPTDILILDTGDVDTAQYVLRINVNGIGFSSTGVDGEYRSAWTLDGRFVADFITAGTLSANRIRGGTLALGGADNGNGVILIYDANNQQIGKIDKLGAQLTGDFKLKGGRTEFDVSLQNVVVRSGSGIKTTKAYARTTNYRNQNQNTTACDTLLGSGNSVYASTVLTKGGQYQRLISACDLDALDGITGTIPPQFTAFEGIYGGMFNIYGGDHEDEYIPVIFTSIGGSASRSSEYYNTGGRYVISSKGFYSKNGSGQGDIIQREGWFSYNSGWEISVGETGIYFAGQGHGLEISDNAIQIDRKNIQLASSSSKRYKEGITEDVEETLDPERLYELKAKQFRYKKDALLQYEDMRDVDMLGFIAEDVNEVYPSAVIHDKDGNIESWDERRLLPAMLSLIQKQKKEIDTLKEEVKAMKREMEGIRCRFMN